MQIYKQKPAISGQGWDGFARNQYTVNGETANFIGDSYPSVAAWTIVWSDPYLKYTLHIVRT